MQQHGSKTLSTDRPDPGVVQELKIQLFQNMVMLHIKLKGITTVATYILPADPHFLTLGMGSKFNLFSEHGHVAYQIKGNLKCSNMEANIFWLQFPPLPPDPGGLMIKIQLFQNMFMLHNKSNGITNAATW